jgi:hypothetical protein
MYESYAQKRSVDFFDNSGGLNLKSSPLTMPQGDTPDSMNMDHGITGSLAKRKGCSVYSTALNASGWPVHGLFRLKNPDGNVSLVVAAWRKLYAELNGDGDFSTVIGSGYNENYNWDGNVASGKLFLTNGYNTPKQWDGTTLSDMPTTEVFYNRMGPVVTGTWTGTTTTTIRSEGTYQGSRLEVFTFTIEADKGAAPPVATIATDEIRLNWVSDLGPGGTVIISEEYTAGGPVHVTGGFYVTLTAGDVTDGDTFTVSTVAYTGDLLPVEWELGAYPTHFTTVNQGKAESVAAWGCSTATSRLWFSELQVPTNFAYKTTGVSAVDPWYIDVLPDDGEPVTMVVDLAGYWIVFKKTRSRVYAGDSPDNVQGFGIYPVGCSAPRSLVRVGNDIYFWSQHGPARASGIQEYGDIEPMPISTKVKARVNQIREADNVNIVAIHDNNNNRIVWYYTPSGQTASTSALVYHYDTGGWDYYEGLGIESAVSYFSSGLGEVHLLGTSDGRVVKYNDGYTDAGAAYRAYYTTPWYNLGDTAIRKRTAQLLVALGASGLDVNVEYRLDLEGGWTDVGSLINKISGDLALWDNVYWDEFNWDEGITNMVMLHLEGSFRMIQLRFSNDDLGDAFELLGWSLLTTHHGER